MANALLLVYDLKVYLLPRVANGVLVIHLETLSIINPQYYNLVQGCIPSHSNAPIATVATYAVPY